MQPYFFPYLGYFQLINAVDKFVVYDNIEFTKKGWINRNRVLVNGKDEYITLPLKKGSDFLHIKDRILAENWETYSKKMNSRIIESYRKAPQFEKIFPLIERCISYYDTNLFNFIFNSIRCILDYFEIDTKLIVSSTIPINHQLRSESKVIALCKAMHADIYINPIGGVNLYSKEKFETENLKLQFLKSDLIIYKQFDNDFIPWLSIIDVMMFNSKGTIVKYLDSNHILF
jgi:hypothetical protein